MNASLAISRYLTQNITGRCEDVQLSVCEQYDSNIITPLVVAVALLLFRWIVVYRIDKVRHPRTYMYLETGTDIGAVMAIVTSIIWVLVGGGG